MSLKGTVWTPIGPSPIDEGGNGDNGLVTAIAPHPTNPNILYIGTAGGGVWKSEDQGKHWTPLFDRQMSLAIGENAALAIDPSNPDTIYAGTSGRLIFRTFSSDTGTFTPVQVGIYKSTDGGASWILLGSGFPANNNGNANRFAGQECNVLIVDPANSNVLYLAASTGLYVSRDGGQNWTQGSGVFVDTRTLALDATSPVNARILYAGVTGQGIFKSTDGGNTWNAILSGATAVLANALCPAPPCIPPRSFGMFVVALAPPASPPNPAGIQVLYATMEGNPTSAGAPNPVGIFVSTNQGATWTQQGGGGIATTTYGGYCLVMAVDPASPGDGVHDILYFGDIFQSVSKDSGNTFSGISGTHADTHALGFIRRPSPATSIALIGCDGGIFISLDTGSSWSSLNSGGLQTGLFYNIDVRPDSTASVTVGALQDNSLETTAGASGLGWNAGGADGFAIKYDSGIASQVYGCENSGANSTAILLSTDDGQSYSSITPWSGPSDTGIYIAPIGTDPNTGGIVYALGSQNLWQTQNGGGSWRNIFPNVGGGGNDINVATTNGNNVVIAVGTSVFVSTNALAATIGLPAGVTFKNITRNLPTRNVARVAFDPADPSTVYAVLGGLGPPGGGPSSGHVFRTTITSPSWTDISPPLNIPFSALALDGSDTPTTIYAGTEFGVLRSVDLGQTWYILDDIHFPHVPVMSLALHNGVLRAGTYGRGVFGFTKPVGPSIAVNLQNHLKFGTICSRPEYLTLEIFNVGVSDLVINSVQRLMGSGDFTVLSTPGTPVIVAPGEDIEFTVQYLPTVSGTLETAIIRISSNDPMAPFVDLPATGIQGTGAVATAIANSGSFGNVCLGSFVDEMLTINNPGTCPLSISNITSSSPDFDTPSVLSYPLVVSSGGSINVVFRFQPSSFGAKFGTITIIGNAPAGPHTVFVSGVAQAPRLNLIIANRGNFGKVCVGSFKDEPLILTNSGKCTLTVTGIVSSSGEFIVPEVLSFPITIGPGNSLPIPIRFEPVSFGSKSATITVTSDDQASPRTIDVSGNAPPGKLAVTGSTTFGGVNACCCADRTISICNVGECTLHVTSVRFKRKSQHWRLIHNPFPAKLRPGSCLSVLIQYRATEKCPRCCELVIESDDPVTPVKILDVLAYTIWDSCCKEHCEGCRKGCCDKHHNESCCQQGYACCCEDDEDDEDES
jgi:photosystem II stability/assembly factor-like uncharacterized protein